MDPVTAVIVYKLACLAVAVVAIVGGLVLTARGQRKRDGKATELTLGPLALRAHGPGLGVVALGVAMGLYVVQAGLTLGGDQVAAAGIGDTGDTDLEALGGWAVGALPGPALVD